MSSYYIIRIFGVGYYCYGFKNMCNIFDISSHICIRHTPTFSLQLVDEWKTIINSLKENRENKSFSFQLKWHISSLMYRDLTSSDIEYTCHLSWGM